MLALEKRTDTVNPKITNQEMVYPAQPIDYYVIDFGHIFQLNQNTDLLGYVISKPKLHQYLSRNIDVFLKIPETIRTVNDLIGTNMMPQFELVTDEEDPEHERLALIFNLKDKSYEEILKLWDQVSKKAYENLNNYISKKIAIILDGE
jgi:hypothetical protein